MDDSAKKTLLMSGITRGERLIVVQRVRDEFMPSIKWLALMFPRPLFISLCLPSIV